MNGTIEKFLGFEIDRHESERGAFYAKATRIKTGKTAWYYSFRTPLQREQYIAEFNRKEEEAIKRRETKASAKAAAREQFVNPYKVGDILYGTWGYDQTNVEFAQVIEVGKRSVILREIGQERTETTHMAGNCIPLPGKFIGEPFRVTIQISVSYDGEVYHYLPAKHWRWSPWHGRSVGYSQYA